MNKYLITSCLTLIFQLTFVGFVFADSDPISSSGSQLMRGIDAYHLMQAKKNIGEEELFEAGFLIGTITGVVGVQKSNNLITSTIISTATDKEIKGKSDPKLITVSKVAIAYSPLLMMPKDVDAIQIIAILDRYLKDNPEKWNLTISELITNALQNAFPYQNSIE